MLGGEKLRLARVDQKVKVKSGSKKYVGIALVFVAFGFSLYLLTSVAKPPKAEIIHETTSEGVITKEQIIALNPTQSPTVVKANPTSTPIKLASRGDVDRSEVNKKEGYYIPSSVGKDDMMSLKTFNALYAVGVENQLPIKVWFPIAMLESGGDPKCDTGPKKTEHSHGIFQVNMYSHPKADPNKLFDPTYNARWQMPVLAKVYQDAKEKGLNDFETVVYVEKYGERPLWTASSSAKIRKVLQYYLNQCK